MFQANRFLAELSALNPEMDAAVRTAWQGAEKDLDFLWIPREPFARSPAMSIDYAVMERTRCAATVLLDAGWSDVGSFASLWEVAPHDDQGNVSRGEAFLIDTSDSLVLSKRRLIGTLGVSNLVIVESDDAILVADRRRSEDTTVLVGQLATAGRQELVAYNCVYRPWGHYEHLDGGVGFQIKLLSIRPHLTLSQQAHGSRAKHWIVVHGTATVVRDDETLQLGPNQSTYMPVGTRHRLVNDTDELLNIIEIRSGDYHGQDDSERCADDFDIE